MRKLAGDWSYDVVSIGYETRRRLRCQPGTDNGDPNIEVGLKRECVNCAQDIPTVQIVEGPIEVPPDVDY